ncbi:hypothetical protein BHM03_00016192, partial [Ensete ventricosum]
MGGTYRSARLPVRGPSAIGRFCQKSTVGGRLSEKKGGRRRRGKIRKKKKRGEKKPIARARSSPVRRRRLRAIVARGSWALFLPRGEKDRGDSISLTWHVAFAPSANLGLIENPRRNVSPRREKDQGD